MVGNGLCGFELEVDIIDAQLVVEPSSLLVDEAVWDPSAFADVFSD
jgi:hypothetical protein